MVASQVISHDSPKRKLASQIVRRNNHHILTRLIAVRKKKCNIPPQIAGTDSSIQQKQYDTHLFHVQHLES
ncbi:hypothetical protein BRADI_5g08645v3 [Brachypodium distachyon]|uniref:Uncharacterized protein n=1 Tax=Brachypodium distachyon TaxID=15368 RepID=A0A0Q3E7S5_BRADI|nr:hypothetical protein BRADI_5g08645v3 [Brachypodium distachyon]